MPRKTMHHRFGQMQNHKSSMSTSSTPILNQFTSHIQRKSDPLWLPKIGNWESQTLRQVPDKTRQRFCQAQAHKARLHELAGLLKKRCDVLPNTRAWQQRWRPAKTKLASLADASVA